MKLCRRITSLFLCFVLIFGFVVYDVDNAQASSGYKWRVTVYIDQGSSLYQEAYIDLNYILMDGSGTLGHVTISNGIGAGTPWNDTNNKYYSFVSDSSISANGNVLSTGQSLPSNAMPISVDAYCALSGIFFTTPSTKWKVLLEIFDSNNRLIGDSSYCSLVEISSVFGEFVSGTATDQLAYEYYEDYYASNAIPVEYDFDVDRYNFPNFSETIALQYYIDLYGQQKGTEIYNFRGEKTAHGHCFGMSVSTAATLINAPYVTDYISWLGLPYTKLSSVNEGTMNIDMDISAKDYIKYCHIYQNSAFVSRQRNSENHSGIDNVYNAVKCAATSNTESTMTVIDLFGGSGGHTVYAVGVDGSDILVNDSNAKDQIQRIKVNGSDWTYSAAGLYWDSTVDATINYIDNCIEPYLRLVWNIDVEGGTIPGNTSISNSYTEDSELYGINSYYSNYIEPIDTDKLLIVTENDEFSFSEPDNIYKVSYAAGDVAENEDGLYWLDSGNTINAKNESDDSAMLKLVGNEMKISAEMPVDSSAQMTINENGENKILFDVNEEENLIFTFTTLDANDTFVNTILSGTANGCDVVAMETENGIQVNGLNDITVSYETVDGIIKTNVKVDDGSIVKITVNEEENVLETDWNCKHSFDSDTDNICDNCGDVINQSSDKNNCSHLCHSSNAFMKFIWKVINFFSKLFGVNPTCSCGAAHY